MNNNSKELFGSVDVFSFSLSLLFFFFFLSFEDIRNVVLFVCCSNAMIM